MCDLTDFNELVWRASQGDEAASAELVREFEPFLQRVARIRMRKRGDYDRLRREFGSSDVCQSVFKSLFRGLKHNRYAFTGPDDLKKLLQTMVRFNIATKARRSAVRLRALISEIEELDLSDDRPPPDEEVADRELIEAIQEEFSEEELQILTLWLDDLKWAQIGERLGENPDAIRFRLRRAFERVRRRFRAES
jgi:RNA polymerase sigma factor (sigma-70 family)